MLKEKQVLFKLIIVLSGLAAMASRIDAFIYSQYFYWLGILLGIIAILLVIYIGIAIKQQVTK
ncbi:MAG: hypothetical protein Q8Q20_05870 [bacterium]|nr:hypothetical protein [bacterium]